MLAHLQNLLMAIKLTHHSIWLIDLLWQWIPQVSYIMLPMAIKISLIFLHYPMRKKNLTVKTKPFICTCYEKQRKESLENMRQVLINWKCSTSALWRSPNLKRSRDCLFNSLKNYLSFLRKLLIAYLIHWVIKSDQLSISHQGNSLSLGSWVHGATSLVEIQTIFSPRSFEKICINLQVAWFSYCQHEEPPHSTLMLQIAYAGNSLLISWHCDICIGTKLATDLDKERQWRQQHYLLRLPRLILAAFIPLWFKPDSN